MLRTEDTLGQSALWFEEAMIVFAPAISKASSKEMTEGVHLTRGIGSSRYWYPGPSATFSVEFSRKKTEIGRAHV